MLEQLAPFDRLGQDRAQRVEFPIDGTRPDRFWGTRRLVAPPLPRQPFAFELLDPMRRDLVQDQRAERAIESLDDFAVAIDAPLLLFGVVAYVRRRERPKRDVGLLPDAMTPIEDPRAFLRFDLLRVLLVRGLGCAPIPLPIDAKVVKPVMLTVRRRRAPHRIRTAVLQ
ncbi:MAG TPA: hypothetical protein VFA27_15415 [Vicinamibacterales bacterium]|nr:hypothetical protein [Vicinamibacterales bacterium]